MKDQPHPETEPPTVRVRYECTQCRRGIWHDLRIREREPDEPLEKWQADVALVIGTHHRLNSPRCRSVHMNLKVTVSKSAGYRLGDAPPATPKPTGPTVPVVYTCKACGINERVVQVPERGKDQDVGEWARVVMGAAIGADHFDVSPDCTCDTIDMVKIPLAKSENARIGDAIRQ